jgi:hypothetical protein
MSDFDVGLSMRPKRLCFEGELWLLERKSFMAARSCQIPRVYLESFGAGWTNRGLVYGPLLTSLMRVGKRANVGWVIGGRRDETLGLLAL